MSRRVLLGAGAGAAAAGIFYFVQFLHCRTNLVFFKADVSSKLISGYIITFSWFSPLRREAFLARIQLKLKLKIRASTSSTTKPQLLLQQPSPPSRPLAATKQKYKNHT